jgi:outer membrane protein assembly factor BamB/predicted Ser/Thr protein kinase
MSQPLPEGTAHSPGWDNVTVDPRGGNEQATQVVAVLDKYLAELKAGEQPDRERLLAENPQIADQLAACLAGIEFIHGGATAAQPSGKRLGEFRIIREIGHGGMGAVYEAEQISLGRHVALKVLRFGPVSDQDAVQRFTREAETVAKLHHTNIVPIFAHGSQHGVNYYAMQYIVGRSLDQVLRESGKPIPVKTVAEWGLQAAEALAHAHARGVVHRDVKPSNLLIDDEEGRIWLTDFGLAKRVDDVTLSMTGAIMGTPRYMSPEQAMAAHNKLDHRTDLYSLGATLYELATNMPVFTGDSPHNIIMQILETEPVPARKHVPSLPRDLDTILMKCLAKEPSRRYASARDLAEDLRAFLDNRPISARRTSIAELAVRWVKKQQRSLVLTVGAVAATLLLVVGSMAGSYFWQRSRLAFVKLETDHPPVVSEILDGTGKAVTPKTTLPMQQFAEVPAGEHRLRVHADQRFSQDYQISLSPGQHLGQKLDVEDQLLWSDFKYPRTFAPVVITERGASPAGRKSDLLLMNDVGVQRFDGLKRAIVWSLNLGRPEHEVLTKDVKVRWPWNYFSVHGAGIFDEQPRLVSAADAGDLPFDLNGDGISDLLIAARHQAWMLALSGSDGAPLWLAARGDVLPRGGVFENTLGVNSAVPYVPLVVADQDGDGVADLATWFMTAEPYGGKLTRTLELLSGKTGASIWKYEAPADLFVLPANTAVPAEFRWYHGSGGGYSGGSSGGHWEGPLTRRAASSWERSAGQIDYLPSAVSLASGGKQLSFLAGTHFVNLDLQSGEPSGKPIDSTIRPTLVPRWADFDGDRQADVLLTTALPELPAGGGRHATPQLQLAAWSPAQQKELWRIVVTAQPPLQQTMSLEAPVWPIVNDLDGDGVAEVLVPEASSIPEADWRAPWGTLAVLEGRSGQVRWRRTLRNLDQQLDTFVAGPDIDGDGCREVFVASLWNENYELFLDCFSGRDGKSLWRARQALQQNQGSQRLAPLQWYEQGGRSQLLVRLQEGDGLRPSFVGLFAAESGEMQHLAAGAVDAKIGDFDGNVASDLLLVRPNNMQFLDEGGTLQAFRGQAGESWRRLASAVRPLFDFDRDGVSDLVESQSGCLLVARSGASSAVLWGSDQSSNAFMFPSELINTNRSPEAAQDFNGDGVPDLLLHRTRGSYSSQEPIVTALSGATGRTIWRSEAICHTVEGASLLEARDLDGDGEAEVICIAPMDYGLPQRQSFSTNDPTLWLLVMSGRDGKTRFAEELSPDRPNLVNGRGLFIEPAYADLNGDRVLDVVVPAIGQKTGASEARAISGKDGKPLWQAPLPQDRQDGMYTILPAVADDLDGDGRTEVMIGGGTEVPNGQYATMKALRLVCVDGKSGESRWQQDTPVDQWSSRIDEERRVANRPRPIVVRRGGKEKWIALLSFHEGYKLRLFNAQGQIVSERTLTQSTSDAQYPYLPYRPWTCDVDADGRDELVLFDGDALAVVPADQLDQPLWQSRKREWTYGAVQGVLHAAPGGPQIVLRGRAGDTSLFGLSAKTGEKLWTCPAPNMTGDNWATLLRSPGDGQPPLAHYNWNNVSLVREGLFFDESPKRVVEKKVALPAVGQDPRLLRSLPWAMSPQEAANEAVHGLWGLFYSITLVGIPVGFIISLLRRRKWGMRTMLMLPVVAGLFLMGALIQGPDSMHRTLPGKLVESVTIGGPILLALYTIGRWTWRRQWRPACTWLSVGPLLALIAVAVLLAGFFPKHEDPLEPGERWSWDGWYWVIVYGYFASAWCFAIAMPPWWLGRWIWQMTRGVKSAPLP